MYSGFYYIVTITSEFYTFICSHVTYYHTFISAWGTPFSISCKANLVELNLLNFYLGSSSRLLIWRAALLGKALFVFFFFQCFECIIVLSLGLQGLCWESYWQSYGYSLLYEKVLFLLLFSKLSPFLDFQQFNCHVFLWSPLDWTCLETFELYEPGHLYSVGLSENV